MSQEQTSNTKQAAWVAIGNFFSFIVGIVSPMILSRYFDKGDYGTYKQVMFVYGTLLTIFTLGLPRAYAYFLPKYSRNYAKDIINRITRIFFVLGFFFSLFLLSCAGPIALALKNPDLKMALMVFSPTPFLLLPTMGLDAIFVSFKKTKYLTYYTIGTRIFTVICTVLPVVLFSGNYIYAIIGFDFASLITFFLALYLKTWPVNGEEYKRSDIKLKQIFDFALPLLYAAFWGLIIYSSNQFFISRYFGNETFAEFSNGFMELPIVGMIISSVAAVLLPVFSGMDDGKGMSDDTLAIWNSALIKSAKLIFPISIYSVCFADILMACMYGDLYVKSSIYFVIKNLGGLFYIVPFYPIILAIGKTRAYANIHMIVAITIVVAEYIGCQIVTSAIYIAVISELCHFLKIIFLMRVIAKYANKRIVDLISPKELGKLMMVSVFASVIPFIFFRLIDLNKFVVLFCSLMLFVIIYYGLCWLFKVSYKDIIMGYIGKKKINERLIKIIP